MPALVPKAEVAGVPQPATVPRGMLSEPAAAEAGPAAAVFDFERARPVGDERPRVGAKRRPLADADEGLTSVAARRAASFSGTLLLLALLTYWVAPWQAYRPWAFEEGDVPFWNLVGRELLGQGKDVEAEEAALNALVASRVRSPDAADTRTPEAAAAAPSDEARAAAPSAAASSLPAPAQEERRFASYQGHADDSLEPVVKLEGGERLARFFDKLALVESGEKGAVARVGHWGDSVLGNDGVTSALRRRFQARFGDAGHGYHLLARYNLAYRHQGIIFAGHGSWRKCEIIFKCEADGHYGYGGVSTTSSGGGTGVFTTTKQGFGSAVSHFELWYHRSPKGGKFQIKVDGEVRDIVNTFDESVSDDVYVLDVEDGSHSFEVRAIGDGLARGYGVVLERAVPGVVWDGLSLIGSFTQRLDYQEPAHIQNQIARRDNDLLVFLLGGNDVQREKMDLYRTMEPYEQEYTRVIRKFRKGKPAASCLVMSVTDHGERVGTGTMRTRRILPRMVDAQRKVALAEGCAFFDTFTAMGGAGSIVRWYRAKPPLAGPDLAHPTSLGHEAIAELLYAALSEQYAIHRRALDGKQYPEWWTNTSVE